jgi:hypothetical protein
MEPQVKSVQDANRKENSTSKQKAPQTLAKTGKDMIEPCCHTDQN